MKRVETMAFAASTAENHRAKAKMQATTIRLTTAVVALDMFFSTGIQSEDAVLDLRAISQFRLLGKELSIWISRVVVGAKLGAGEDLRRVVFIPKGEANPVAASEIARAARLRGPLTVSQRTCTRS